VSKATALGVADYTGLFNSHVSVKWPNDIFVDNKKISGILIECSWKGSRVEWMVLGIGFNLNQDIFPTNLKNPVSLKMLTGIVFNPEESLRLLANSVMSRYQQVIRKEFELLDDQFERQLYGLGRIGVFDTPKGKLRAMIKGVNPKGNLVVELPDGKAKELSFPSNRLHSLEKF
jgi:BirA family biotin operon repressor/biotin-[acetyl-CoA-carboxylase] ligase